ncbi:SusD/RagB family nutrient-binding outer membrane lipoprotein [Dyadobacter sp. 22481]|uniref:SusD/RagB family nutrient-binding outer membrane lipoprotein n=1 Tax=Dyadobacter sp. 22481 TaxID=3453926 RepID=UPI003F85CD59
MKNIRKITTAMLLASSLACTNGFEEINTDPNRADQATSAQLLTNAQYNFSTNITDEWNNGRFGMYYAQYWSSTYYSDESRYQIRENTNQIMWNTFYTDVLNELHEAQKIEKDSQWPGHQNRLAISEIMKAYTYHFLTDIYGGPIPYAEALNADDVTPVYNTGEEVYAGLLATLDEQVKSLDAAAPSYATGDVLYGGNVNAWKRFANSLRLRIALRMIDVKPAEATEAIRKALDPANGGIISTQEHSALFRWLPSPPNNNPMNQSFKVRVDFSMSKPFIDYLKQYADPRLPVFAQPLLNTNNYVGEVYGRENSNASSNGDPTLVSLPADYAVGATAPTIWLDLAEVKFMLAEIQARELKVGLTGTAAQYYQEGIAASMRFAGVREENINAYLKKVPYNAAKWKDSIGSQKWIAMYTQGIQGWLERLRLDFKDPITGKAIFALPADGSLDPDVTDISKRMSYPLVEASLNGTHYRTAVEKLGGRNSKAVKNWWDKY